MRTYRRGSADGARGARGCLGKVGFHKLAGFFPIFTVSSVFALNRLPDVSD